MKMEKRRLGRTGLEVSVVGIGTLGFPRAKLSHKETVSIVQSALDMGVNIIDTAHSYAGGEMERVVGEATEDRRDEVVILSRSVARDPATLRKHLAESLERLRTDVIDIYQIHDVTPPGDLAKVLASGTVEELKAARAAGKVRFIGLSTHGTVEDMRKMITSGEFDVLTVAYNLTHHKRTASDGDDLARMPREVFPLAREHDVGLTVMKPLGGGRLTRIGPSGTPPIDPTKAIRFVVQEPCIGTVTPGIGSVAELEQALAAGDPGNALSDEDIAALKEYAHKWGTDFCRQCGYCEPCDENVPIRKIMLLAEKLADPTADKTKLRQGYADLETNGEACVECEKCEEKCPYDLPIMERIGQVHKALA